MLKFIGVLLDENLPGKGHINYIENKVAKDIVFYMGPSYFQIKTRNLHYTVCLHAYFYMFFMFSTQPQCCLTFS